MRQSREILPKITPKDDSGYFEELTKAIFRAGFNWGVVQAKWAGFRSAFHDVNAGVIMSHKGGGNGR